MKVVSLPVSRMSLCALMCLTASCAMPPREAWRIVQKQGLISYWSGNYVTPETNRYLATSTPLQPRHYNTPIPYRRDEAQPHYDEAQPHRDVVVPYRAREDRVVAETKYDNKPANKPEPAPKPQRSPSKSRSENAPVRDNHSSSSTPKFSVDTLPYGTPVAGRPGMVMSPFATKEQLVDVTGMAAGDPVKCPYSGKLFRVPPTQQAASSSKSSEKAAEKETEPPPPPPPHLSPAPPASTTPPATPEPKTESKTEPGSPKS